MRLFIAIPLPAEIKEQLHELMESISGIRWQNYKQLHITLKFLGETEAEKVEKLITGLNSVEQTSFSFMFNGVGYFPQGKQPRILWVGMEDETLIVKLQHSIEDKCIKAGFEAGSRPYKPHITLGKVKGASKREVMTFINQHKQLSLPEIPVEEFILYESKLRPDGAIHKPCARFQLSNNKTGKSNNQ